MSFPLASPDMRRPAVDKLVYKSLFPRPKPGDPQSFLEFLERYLVLEVRQEVHSFYGHLDTQEAKYPGLDYSHPTHRIRLGRWPWHRRLFRAFDSLGLTPAEIAQLTKWEGTKWAKERYEKEQNITILDTAADGMPDYRAIRNSPSAESSRTASRSARLPPRSAPEPQRSQLAQLAQLAQTPQMSQPSLSRDTTLEPPLRSGMRIIEEAMSDADMICVDDNDDGVDVDQSIGLQLNEQLRERVAAHHAGDTSQSLDEDWEQWLKTAIESGDVSAASRRIHNVVDLPFMISSVSPEQADQADQAEQAEQADPAVPTSAQRNALQEETTVAAARILEAARQENWAEVPQFLQTVLRDANQLTDARQGDAADSVDATPHIGQSSTWRRTYSSLRLPRQ